MRPAFQHLNLVRNPFGVVSPEVLANIAVADISHLVDELQKPNTAIQFLAGHGRGKTTNLLALHAYLPEASYTQLHPGDENCFGDCEIRFIDSIENLSRGSRQKLYQASTSIALTTHKNLTMELKRHGYQVITIKVSTSDPQMLQNILNRRIEYCRRGPDLIPVLTIEDVNFLKRRFKDDIRSMQSYLYDVFQHLDAPQNLQLG